MIASVRTSLSANSFGLVEQLSQMIDQIMLILQRLGVSGTIF
ncbi:hypothetical protein CEV33_1124 [Brucella grignonensis]|uniref:Uncharacterized protein n=1 Tax=Brucella grignonensis TaxID=94627 RepID=A0A256FC79_9HYPH|nr:hypothetical protein CEV33_1124 [Brucella grignonensis]